MDNLIQLAMQILFCLLIAAILGAIIGYLLGKMSKCDKDDYDYNEKDNLSDYGSLKNIKEDTNNEIQKDGYDYNKKDNLNDYNSLKDIKKGTNNEIQAVASISAAEKVAGTLKNTATKEITKETGIQVGQEIGTRPHIITNPEKSEIDDLKEISGIGLKIEEALNGLGIYSFEQIANWDSESIEWIENYLVFKGRIKKEDWVGQAKLLFAGGETEFSKKVRRGENPNY
jgi:predicted flap endonuclease-1-like 5' DNA nuclease